jgi:hypothetical protein
MKGTRLDSVFFAEVEFVLFKGLPDYFHEKIKFTQSEIIMTDEVNVTLKQDRSMIPDGNNGA